MTAIISVKDVANEMDSMSDEISSFINKRTGELVTLSDEMFSAVEEGSDINKYPAWQQEDIIKAKEVLESDDYLQLPSKFDIHEYHIMEEFCRAFNDSEISNALLSKIKGRGAFSRFKEAIRRYDIENEWFEFREKELEKIAIEWLKKNHIAYTEK
jgi:methyltransferase-like protein